jgi:hypothetical protein
MALKSGRSIIIDDRRYHWKFKAHKDGLTRFGQSARHAHVAVHAEEGPGKMVAHVETTLEVPGDSDLQCGATHKARFTPGDVRKIIEAGLAAGWDLNSKTQFKAPEGIELTDYRTTL